MADELDALLERIEDPGLASELRGHIERLRRRRQFGLVFESHLPERVRLPDHPIRRGAKVVRRDAPAKEAAQEVLRTKGSKVVLATEDGSEEVARDDLVVVAEFGEPIYPGLRRLGSVDRGGDKPAHVVIKGENYHALEALRFTHAGMVDCIYIDPPYNNREKDWKYNNDYVDKDDAFRHSKWLAFMSRRLLLARDLLRAENSFLIVTIDENEYMHLGMLLKQLFPDARTQMVSIVSNPKGTGRSNEFSRVDEFAYFVLLGDAAIPSVRSGGEPKEVRWKYLRRTDVESARGTRKGGPRQFYPVYVNEQSGQIVELGEPLSPDDPLDAAPSVAGAVAVFPIREDGRHMNWGLTAPTLQKALDSGFVRVTPGNDQQQFTIAYLSVPNQRKALSGTYVIAGERSDGSKIVVDPGGKASRPTTAWREKSHEAGPYGTSLLGALIPDRKFPFPKSLHAVEDCIALAALDKPKSVVLDFFAGSGTTAHAVARLNQMDGGARQSISVTNNEVSADEARGLRESGFRPGDSEWESLGIFEYVTRPRLLAAMSGETPAGEPVEGDYKFNGEFPIADGLDENVEFLELRYLDIEDVELDLAFESVAPLLWMRSGGRGPVIDQRCDEDGAPKGFDCTAQYGVLFEPDRWRGFVQDLPESVSTVFVVTDSPSVFASVAAELPSQVDVVRLYENYLSTFAINRGR